MNKIMTTIAALTIGTSALAENGPSEDQLRLMATCDAYASQNMLDAFSMMDCEQHHMRIKLTFATPTEFGHYVLFEREATNGRDQVVRDFARVMERKINDDMYAKWQEWKAKNAYAYQNIVVNINADLPQLEF